MDMGPCCTFPSAILLQRVKHCHHFRLQLYIFPIGGVVKGGFGTRKGGYAQSSSRRVGSNDTHFNSQNHSIYTYSVFFFGFTYWQCTIVTIFFYYKKCQNIIEWNEKKKKNIWCRWWWSANHHCRLSSERGSQVPLTVIFRWHLTRQINIVSVFF